MSFAAVFDCALDLADVCVEDLDGGGVDGDSSFGSGVVRRVPGYEELGEDEVVGLEVGAVFSPGV